MNNKQGDVNTLGFMPDRRNDQRITTVPRRSSDRLYGPCVAIVKGMDANGHEFREEVTLHDVSARGLYLKMKRTLMLGTRIFVVFVFSAIALKGQPAPVVAVRGVVQRVEAMTDQGQGVAVAFQQHRFL